MGCAIPGQGFGYWLSWVKCRNIELPTRQWARKALQVPMLGVRVTSGWRQPCFEWQWCGAPKNRPQPCSVFLFDHCLHCFSLDIASGWRQPCFEWQWFRSMHCSTATLCQIFFWSLSSLLQLIDSITTLATPVAIPHLYMHVHILIACTSKNFFMHTIAICQLFHAVLLTVPSLSIVLTDSCMVFITFC